MNSALSLNTIAAVVSIAFPYTAPTNGMFFAYKRAETGEVRIWLDGVTVGIYAQTHNYSCTNISFIAGKGQTVTTNTGWDYAAFIPFS